MEWDLEWDLDRDLERLRDLEADFVDLDIIAASPPQTGALSRHIQAARCDVEEMG